MIRHAALALLLLLLLLLLACPMLRVTGEPANNKRYINAVPYEGHVQIINDCKNKYCRVLVDGLASIASFETHDISHYGPLFIDASRVGGEEDGMLFALPGVLAFNGSGRSFPPSPQSTLLL
ncbi:putative tetratricopeptide repeat domain protein [Trichinella spiralis]|uniref:putative tetratricopeptide repeat domain protein n=1 Tax=Trichinella spiralis TaxID=6334 RepID=UPI0001EFB324|nr:putative tetratricopeptide repeat domain protein [Trichinella spiralis]